MMNFTWDRNNTADEINTLLSVLGAQYPLTGTGTEKTVLKFRKDEKKEGFTLSYNSNVVEISYSDVTSAARGLGHLLAGLEKGTEISEVTSFGKRGIMLDVSRNAVARVDWIKSFISQMALYGFNLLMLYTEDTYRLKDEPFFGYMRGAYSEEDLRSIDDYAFDLGIEVVGCIQTLGHMEQILRWEAYSKIKDTTTVMMIDKEETYLLIEKMIAHFSSVLRSGRIHIGMDEAFDMGRGKFQDHYGQQDVFSIFCRHLEKVNALCIKYNLEPMIWSDMYFNMGSKDHAYYDLEADIPGWVAEKLPENVSLVYWDYYHDKEDFYDGMLNIHEKMTDRIKMASGIWTWCRLWTDFDKTMETATPCIASCKEHKIDEIYFTMWGDDGAYCDFDSALPGMALCADQLFSGEGRSDLEARFRAITGGSLKAKEAAGKLQGQGIISLEKPFEAPSLLWDDPLMGIYWNHFEGANGDRWSDVLEYYTGLAGTLETFKEDRKGGDNLYAWKLADLFARKIAFRQDLIGAYKDGNKEKLQEIRFSAADLAVDYEELSKIFREQWLSRNRRFGLEMIQIRFAGLAARYLEAEKVITEYLDGTVHRIAELDEPVIPGIHQRRFLYNGLGAGSVVLEY